MPIGQNISLTAFKKSESEKLFNWINDPALVRYSSNFKPIHENQHEKWFDSIGNVQNRIYFGIRKKSGELIGMIQLADIHPIARRAELIIRIGEASEQGKGYGQEAVSLLLKFAEEELNLTKVFLHVLVSNARAITSYKNVGFVEEGCLKKHVFIGGEWDDLMIMSYFIND